jgi:hypothetical protein
LSQKYDKLASDYEKGATHSSINLPRFRGATTCLPPGATLSAKSPNRGDVSAREQSASELSGPVSLDDWGPQRRILYGLLGTQDGLMRHYTQVPV